MRVDSATFVASLAWLAVTALTVRAQTSPAALPPAVRRAAADTGKAENPHWRAGACRLCHPAGGAEKAIPAPDVDRICLHCHDGQSASVEKHPVGRPAPTPTVKIPAGWPVVNGRLACLTCHDLTPTAGHHRGGKDGVRSESNPDFLRRAPTIGKLAFCGMCHVADSQHGRYSPHRMLTPTGEIRDQACVFCHISTFTPDRFEKRTSHPAPRRDPISLCIGCHTQHIDFFEPGHIGRTATPEIIARIAAAGRKPAGEGATRADGEPGSKAGEAPARLPLGDRNTIVCSTCHNPHEAGLFPASSVLSIGAIPNREALRVKRETQVSARPAPATSQPAPNGVTPAANPPTIPVAVRLGANLCGECHGK